MDTPNGKRARRNLDAQGVGGEEEELGTQHFAHARGDVLLELGEQGSVVGGGEAPQVFGADVVESSF